MSVVSVNIPERVGVAVSEIPVEFRPPKSIHTNWMGIERLCQSLTPWEMPRPNLGKRPKPNLDVPGIKRLFKF